MYLARGSKLLPPDSRGQALTQQWMFFEQNQVETAIGLPRAWRKFGVEQPDAVFEHYRPRAVSALKVLERHLGQRSCSWETRTRSRTSPVRVHADGAGGGARPGAISVGERVARASARQPGWFPLE